MAAAGTRLTRVLKWSVYSEELAQPASNLILLLLFALGIYQAASQISMLFSFILGGFVTMFAPMIADLYERREIGRLEELYRLSTKWTLYLTVPLYLVICLASRELMTVVFGAEFAPGARALIILATGQMANVAMGTVGLLLIMTGRQTRWLLLSLVLLVVDLALNWLLIPRFGLPGAALATAVSLSALFIAGLLQVKAAVGIWPYDRRCLKLIVPALGVGAVALCIRLAAALPPVVTLLLFVAASLGIFAAGLWLLGLDHEDREFLQRVRSFVRPTVAPTLPTCAPPFRSLTAVEDADLVASINRAAPDILWVGLGTPKQERWMAEHRDRLRVPVVIGVGHRRRPPVHYQRSRRCPYPPSRAHRCDRDGSGGSGRAARHLDARRSGDRCRAGGCRTGSFAGWLRQDLPLVRCRTTVARAAPFSAYGHRRGIVVRQRGARFSGHHSPPAARLSFAHDRLVDASAAVTHVRPAARIHRAQLAAALLLAASPVIALCAAVLRIVDPGPIFFTQRRYGHQQRHFTIFKLRTLPVSCNDGSAEESIAQHIPRIARLIRALSIDELPQLWNVVRGDMALVGPRPHPIALDDSYLRAIPQLLNRYAVPPGVTGLAQIEGARGSISGIADMQRRLLLDLEYVEMRSWRLDTRILLRTILGGFRERATPAATGSSAAVLDPTVDSGRLRRGA